MRNTSHDSYIDNLVYVYKLQLHLGIHKLTGWSESEGPGVVGRSQTVGLVVSAHTIQGPQAALCRVPVKALPLPRASVF